MLLLRAALAIVASSGDEDAVLAPVPYLLRHQAQDGSWGRRPPHCTCTDPPPPPTKEFDLPRAADLARLLGDDDPGRRLDAQRELLAMGPEVLPVLAKALETAETEVAARCGDISALLAARARDKGDIELTAHSLLLLMGAGYSHFSKDSYGGICVGRVIERGQIWLQGRLNPDGRFDTADVAANATAALALSEAYGLTGSARFKDDAQRAATAAARVEVGTPRELVWTAFLAASAKTSGLEGDLNAQATRLAEGLERHPGILAAAGHRYLRSILRGEAARLDLSRVPPGRLDPETRCVAAAALLASEGPRSEPWRSWGVAMKDDLVSRWVPAGTRCDRGSWDAPTYRDRLRTTALNGQSLLVYYRYSNQFAVLR